MIKIIRNEQKRNNRLNVVSATEFLGKGRKLALEIDALIQARQRAFELACRAVMPLDNGDAYKKSDERYIAYITLAEKIDARTCWLQEYRERMLTKISLLENTTYRMLLTAYYIDGRTWEQTAEIVGVSMRHIYRLRREALEEMEKLCREK